MNKFMLLAAACILSHGLSAKVEIDIKVDDEMQTICLEEDAQEKCSIGDTRVAIRNKEESEESVSLEVAVDRDGVISSEEVTVPFEEDTSVAGIEISATRR